LGEKDERIPSHHFTIHETGSDSRCECDSEVPETVWEEMEFPDKCKGCKRGRTFHHLPEKRVFDLHESNDGTGNKSYRGTSISIRIKGVQIQMTTAKKQKLPAHGYLGKFHGLNKASVTKKVRSVYSIPKGAKIIVNYFMRDPPSIVYEVEVIVPRRKK